MKLTTKQIVVTLIFALPAFALGRIIWPDSPHIMQPTAAQFPFFVFLAAAEALGFGLAMSFLIFGWPLVEKVKASEPGKVALFLSIFWLLASWWPHDNIHRHIGMDIAALLKVEYGFHLTLLVAAGIVAWHFWKSLFQQTVSSSENQ